MDIRRCYDILDVPLEATAEEIRGHYRDLVNVWHPDQYGANPRLRDKAEKKLAEINAAYDAVMAFVCSKKPEPRQDSAEADAETCGQFHQYGARGTQTRDKPDTPPAHKWATVKKRSLFRRLIVPMMLVSSLASLALIIPKLDGLIQMIRHPETAIEATLNRSFEQLPDTLTNSNPPKGDRSGAAAKREKPVKPKIKKFVEIHLKNGSVIITSSYRLDDDMVIYRTAGGSLGINKSKVAQIKFRELKVQ